MHKKGKSIRPESGVFKNSKETVKPIPKLPRIVHIFAFDGDYPRQALRLDLAYRLDRMILEYFWDRYSVCQFKNPREILVTSKGANDWPSYVGRTHRRPI